MGSADTFGTVAHGRARTRPGGAGNGGLVKVMQFTLGIWGYDVGTPDGVMGPKSRDAILDHQARNGLPKNGQPSLELLNHMLQ